MNKILTIHNYNERKLLLQKSITVDLPFGNKVKSIVHRLIDALKNQGMGAGLAAPQIGINKKIMICSYTRKVEDIEIIINPKYSPKSSLIQEEWEGCFSAPLTLARISRWHSIRASYFDLDGKKIEVDLDGFPARVFQHEYDHLEGELIINQPKKLKTFKDPQIYKEFLATSNNTTTNQILI